MTHDPTTPDPLPLEEVWRRLSERGAPSPELRSVAEAALERNARLPTILDLRGLSDVTDFFLIATGDSDTHARAISENILDRTREAGFRPVGVEGLNAGRWVLMDYVGLIVHVFLGEVREFYRLERLWGDAPVFELE
ncbi:MAG: ribosome silencing factor [Gemmatimonadales bacterium]|nr:ribosome silencing factor [Gemmatimonadales bacterium]MXX79174.1 ribosome silencing factor [Gemmatimonadales bacterium]MYC89340.1 ribosome silencing factor [Candidatus Palauibacter denitrificans]